MRCPSASEGPKEEDLEAEAAIKEMKELGERIKSLDTEVRELEEPDQRSIVDHTEYSASRCP